MSVKKQYTKEQRNGKVVKTQYSFREFQIKEQKPKIIRIVNRESEKSNTIKLQDFIMNKINRLPSKF